MTNAKVLKKNLGQLKNGNPSGNPSNAARCGAKTRNGTSCKAPAMKNGRCHLHGGKSTGPRTTQGLAKSQRGNWKHGKFSVLDKIRALDEKISHLEATLISHQSLPRFMRHLIDTKPQQAIVDEIRFLKAKRSKLCSKN